MNESCAHGLHLFDFDSAGYDRNGLEILGHDESLRLLATKSLGRIGLTVGALPTVLPVNFRLIGERIYFRSSSGQKLTAATSHAVVAFEVDEIDSTAHEGWSVVVTGVAHPVETEAEIARIESFGIPQWAPSDGSRLVSISTDLVTGRRLNQVSIVARPPG